MCVTVNGNRISARRRPRGMHGQEAAGLTTEIALDDSRKKPPRQLPESLGFANTVLETYDRALLVGR